MGAAESREAAASSVLTTPEQSLVTTTVCGSGTIQKTVLKGTEGHFTAPSPKTARKLVDSGRLCTALCKAGADSEIATRICTAVTALSNPPEQSSRQITALGTVAFLDLALSSSPDEQARALFLLASAAKEHRNSTSRQLFLAVVL